MERPFLRWLPFLAGLALFVGAMAWITHRAVALDLQHREAGSEAQRQERVRLALWRMETAASAVFVRESARPSRHYQPFLPVDSLDTGIVQVPSPLLGNAPELVKLHFECDTAGSAGSMCSPQAPVGAARDLAARHYDLGASSPLLEARMKELKALLESDRSWESVAGFSAVTVSGKTGAAQLPGAQGSPPAWAFNELRWRDDTLLRQPLEDQVNAARTPSKKPASGSPPAPSEPDVGEMRALWLGDELVFVRPVRDAASLPRMQGVWMDWPRLQARLIAAAGDLLPRAALEPVRDDTRRADDWMALVSLPVRLVPGEVPLPAAIPASGLKTALVLAWTCLLAAALAIGIVLHRTAQLSERRAAFVSAVTHELRTPLTTFRLYSDLLASGAAPEEERRREYFEILRTESSRLMHLVENVLAYSRVERGRGTPRLGAVEVRALLQQATGRARQRCDEAGLAWKVEPDAAALAARVRVDEGIFEQILFNLADNAAKHAAAGSDPRELVLRVDAVGREVRFTLRDFGPGLTQAQRRALFRPFRKSATEAARGAPGVGLGLALCRRLAREMGGDLRFVDPEGRGAAFVLSARGHDRRALRGERPALP